MDNFKLAVKIEECLAEFNVLDSIEKLIELRKDYKESDFYKKTKMSFEQCLEMYGKIYQLKVSRRSIADMIEDYLLDLDADKIQGIVNRFMANFENLDLTALEEILNGFVKGLNFQELAEKIKEFEELNIRASNL